MHIHWVKYTEKVDQMAEEALRLNVKWSLLELSRALSGDGKSMLDPVFKVKVKLGEGIEFSPGMDEVAGYIKTVCADVIAALSVFQRLPEILSHKTRTLREVGMGCREECVLGWGEGERRE